VKINIHHRAALALATAPAHAQITVGNLNFTVQPSVVGRNYWLQCSDTMAGGTWTDLGVVRSGDGTDLLISTPYVAEVARRFYRVALVEAPAAPAGFSLIPAGEFQMGQTEIAGPVHSVQVSTFYMGKYEVTKALWDEVATWAADNGYDISAAGASGKGTNHPASFMTWYDMVKWCNARSERENLTPCCTVSEVTYKTGESNDVTCNWSANGYRLPSEAEWEKTARGGLVGQRFPWGDTITQNLANYYGYTTNFSCDLGPNGYNPIGSVGGTSPATSPVGSLAANGYGLNDMTGNVWEWCWDCYGTPYAGGVNPRGPSSGSTRVARGGGWDSAAGDSRVAYRISGNPSTIFTGSGLRLARSSVP
jgi:formylglycine-generating enzyme required for sulfatase activity